MSVAVAQGIECWEEHDSQVRWIPQVGDGIATEMQSDAEVRWTRCLDALRGSMRNDIHSEIAQRHVWMQALGYLWSLRREMPDYPPNLVTPEPDGGLIVEWRDESAADAYVFEVTFYNDRVPELTVYKDGKIQLMEDLLKPSFAGLARPAG